jgi:glycosyltransferase involved in cell wall biosynthesis
VLEAMAASLPVMISENVGAKDIVRHGKNGFIIGDGMDPDEIARVIFFLSNNDDLKASIAKEAYLTASRNSWEETAEKTKKIYELCLS